MTADVPTSRGFFGYGCDALAGVVSALILGFALAHPTSVLVLLAYFAAIPLFVVGFAYGPVSGLIAAVIGTAALLVVAPGNVTLFYLITDALPAVGLIYLTLRVRVGANDRILWMTEGALLTRLMIYPCAIFLLICALTATHGGLLTQTLELLGQATDQAGAMLNDDGQTVTPEMMVRLHNYMNILARFAPAMGMTAWLLVTVLAASVAQMILQPLALNIRPAYALDRLRLPNWVLFVALAAGAASFAPAPYGYIALNIAILFAMPFFFTGLAVVHAWAAVTRAPLPILILFYVFIAYLLPLVALLGAVDQWGDFRKKFADRSVANQLTINQGERK